MAHLWVIDPSNDRSGQWCILPLTADRFDVTANPPQPLQPESSAQEVKSKALLKQNWEGAWVLISGSKRHVRVNGISLATGLHVMTDGDEIQLAGRPSFFFSTESLARVEPFPGAGQPIFCPRCKQQMNNGSGAVKCPQCGAWYHQSDELPCWTYAQWCALCPQLTDLNAGYRWTPEEL